MELGQEAKQVPFPTPHTKHSHLFYVVVWEKVNHKTKQTIFFLKNFIQVYNKTRSCLSPLHLPLQLQAPCLFSDNLLSPVDAAHKCTGEGLSTAEWQSSGFGKFKFLQTMSFTVTNVLICPRVWIPAT